MADQNRRPDPGHACDGLRRVFVVFYCRDQRYFRRAYRAHCGARDVWLRSHSHPLGTGATHAAQRLDYHLLCLRHNHFHPGRRYHCAGRLSEILREPDPARGGRQGNVGTRSWFRLLALHLPPVDPQLRRALMLSGDPIQRLRGAAACVLAHKIFQVYDDPQLGRAAWCRGPGACYDCGTRYASRREPKGAHTYIHACIHTYIPYHTYIHTYIPYIHVCRRGTPNSASV